MSDLVDTMLPIQLVKLKKSNWQGKKKKKTNSMIWMLVRDGCCGTVPMYK